MNGNGNHHTLVPEINGRSAAMDFLEEHDALERQLILARDDIASMKEQLIQTTNMVELSKHENEQLRSELIQERARANTWLGYTMKLCGQMAAIKASIDIAQRMSEEAARAAAERGLVEGDKNVKGDDQKALEEIVGGMSERIPTTGLPENKINH